MGGGGGGQKVKIEKALQYFVNNFIFSIYLFQEFARQKFAHYKLNHCVNYFFVVHQAYYNH